MRNPALFLRIAMPVLLSLAAAETATAQEQRKEVTIETTAGNISIALYNETPLHRDNFLKLARQHFYDSLLFHRVVRDFVIQAGDPDSKNAEPGQTLGEGTLDYEIPAEIRMPALYHKRGAVGMARNADDVNPEFRSDACQFYIVWGKRHSTADMESYKEEMAGLPGGSVEVTETMTDTYRKTGGCPHLDGKYTVFGEVTKGLDVIEKIQKADTDDYDRPVDDIRIIKISVNGEL